MKKFLALLLTLVMALTLTGCMAGGLVEDLAGDIQSKIEEEIGDVISNIQDELDNVQSQIQEEIDNVQSQIKDEFDKDNSDTQSETDNIDSSPADNTSSDESTSSEAKPDENSSVEESKIDKNGTYTSKDDVALYIHTYGCLPQNFISKKEAQKLGWTGGSLEKYAPGKCIGGSYFGNYEGLLPEKDGRKYTECDIDTLGKSSRGAKRIVFSNDGLIFYTDDHYESFTQLY